MDSPLSHGNKRQEPGTFLSAPGVSGKSPQPGSYLPGRSVMVEPYSVTTLGIPGLGKSRAPSPLEPAMSPSLSMSPRWQPPMPAGRVGSSSWEYATSSRRKFRTFGITEPSLKNGSLLMLQTMMLGWLRWMRIMSRRLAFTLASKPASSAGFVGYALAAHGLLNPVVPQKQFSDQNNMPN